MLEKEVHRMDVLFPSNFKMLFQKDSLLKAARHEGGVNRRLFLAYATALYGIPMLGKAANINRRMKFASNPFSLGVASGDANSTSVVLWTRLAPNPLDPDGGMPNLGVPVQWRLATDDGMQNIAASGQQLATPQLGHSIHVTAGQLKPDTWYWFQFSVNGEESVVGRTRTMPARFANPKQLSFAAASCQSLEQGYYTAYDRMAEDELDLVFHLGDYIYEYNAGNQGNIRKHHGGEIVSLSDYRVRHAQYKLDPALQKAHARCPWFVTWDDHEVDNNWNPEEIDQEHLDAATQVFFEFLAIRPQAVPQRIWRSYRYGKTLEVFILDSRSERRPTEGLYISDAQMAWLKKGLSESDAIFKVIVNSVPITDMPVWFIAEGDRWEGYPEQRAEILDFIGSEVEGVFWITGDFHFGGVMNIGVPGSTHENMREIMVGPAAQFVNPLWVGVRNSPSVKGQFPFLTGTLNYTRFTLNPEDEPPSLTVEFLTGSGSIIHSEVLTL